MKKNQKTRRAQLFTLAALFVVLMSNVYVGRAQESLKLKWTKTGMSFENICKPGKLIIANRGAIQYLIDLTNGEVIYQTNPEIESGLSTNYFGDKYYFYFNGDNTAHCYDVKSKQYLGKLCASESSDNSTAVFFANNNTFIISNCDLKKITDSVKIPNTPDKQVFNNWSWEYTPDSRYFALTLWTNTTPQVPYFFLYDRTSKEFIFEGKKDFVYCLFNNSSKIAYAENLKLDGDDTTYSYIRIYDPDQRKVIQDIKIAKKEVQLITLRSDDKILTYKIYEDSNLTHFYDIVANKYIDFNLLIPMIIYSDEKMLYCRDGYLYGYAFDWTVGINEQIKTEDTILYPNPTNGILSVKIPVELLGGTWNISDINGKILKKGFILQPDNLQIDVSSLIPQKYILTIQKDKLIKSYHFIKQ